MKEFTAFEAFQMFNVELDTSSDARKSKVRYHEEKYCFNDVRMPLWTTRKRKLPKRVKHFEDHIKPGVSVHPAGSADRVADLIRFYAANEGKEVSAFDIPGIDDV